jgi:triacylglycerol esterase/lipase EstA (alpha/beta hydrolase family)
MTTVITDEMVNKFNGAFYCAGRDGAGHVESIRIGLQAVTPMMLLADTTKSADGAITIDELVEFICASVEKLGYPVGMGTRPNADSMKTAAMKLKRLMDASYSDGYADGYAAAAAFKEHAHDPTE